jgi:uncharacterized membrane protein
MPEGRPRLPEVDLMRATAVLCMIAVHAKMLYLHRQYAHGPVGVTAEILGGAPAAPTFLFLMGLVWALHPGRPWPKVIRRAIEIFLLGYALNFARLTLPIALGAPFPPAAWPETLFMVDILQMAGPAMLLLRAMESAPPAAIALLAAGFGVAGTFLWGTTTSPGPLDIFWGAGNFVYFPFFPWMAFPLAGLLARLGSTKKHLILAAAFLPAGMVASGELKEGFTYYRSSPAQVLWMLGFVLLWREIAKPMATRLPGFLARAVAYLSENVTSFYVFSWLILSWPVFALGYRQRDEREYFVIYFTAVALSILAVAIWREVRRFGKGPGRR